MTELYAKLPPELVVLAREGVFVLLILALTLVALRLVTRLVRWLAARLQAPPLALRPLTVAGRALVVVVVLSTLAEHYFAVDFSAVLGGFLALIGVGFVAVWSTFSNVLCTLILLTVRPFQVGDELELLPDPIRGRVVDLNLFFTTLQAEDGRLIQLPNNFFFQRAVARRRGAHGAELCAQFGRREKTAVTEHDPAGVTEFPRAA